MSDIVKYQENGLVKSDHILLQPNALKAAEADYLIAIKKALLTCYFELNQVVPPPLDIDVLVNKILDSILEKTPAIRAVEIAPAFASGIRKEYGEFYGLCLISFEQFIAGYLTSEVRQKLVRERYKIVNTTTEPTPAEKFDTAKGLSLEVYNQVKNNRAVGITGTAVYTFLNALELIHADYKKGIMKEALNLLVVEKERDITNSTELIRRRQLNADLEMLKENITKDSITVSQHDEVKRVAKRQVLTNWMRDLLLDDTDLDALIDGKRNFYLKK